jgi:peptide/nickel transport system substrate-binding protein
MSARAVAICSALAVIALVLAQFIAPTWPGFHTWQYSAALGLGAFSLISYVVTASKGKEGERGTRLVIAMLGALVICAAGVASGLLGPDSETIQRTPGTVLPLPDVGAAAFFPNVDAAAVARGDERVVLRRKNGSSVDVGPGERRFLGTAAVEAKPRTAAYIEARDRRNEHLTITQPTSPAFLSPVLLFPQTVAIDGTVYPSDTFAIPAIHRQVRALYFSKDAAANTHRSAIAGHEATLFALYDDTQRQIKGGIGLVASGAEITLDEARLKSTLGTYPILVISAVPFPLALWLGGLLFVAGLVYAFVPFSRSSLAAPAALLLALALFLPGCTRVGTGGPGSAALHSWTTPDTVRIGMYEEPDSLNPVIGSMAFASDVFNLMFDGLIRYNEKGEPIPDLAREVPSLANGGISKDGRTLTYHLMPNARWHDGAPLDADDVIYTWRQIMNPNNLTVTRNGYDRITSIEAPDKHTVRIHLKGPYPPALYLFKNLNQGSIVPKHILAGTADINRVPFNSHPLGSGPYIFKGWQHGSEMRFDANPNYFRGKPKIAHVVVRFISDQNTLLAQLQSHEIDLYYGVPAVQVDQVRKISGIVLASRSTLHWEHLNFNTQKAPLDDVRVRRALCYATDEDTIFTKIYRGLGTKGPVHFNPDFEWADRSIKHYPFDLKKAGAMLDDAGWKLGSNGIRYRNGLSLSVVISTVAGVKNREAIEVLLQSWWRSIGVDTSIKNFPAATLFAPAGAGGMLYGGKTDVAIFTWQNNSPDPDDETYMSPVQLPPAGQNVSFYVNQDIGRWQQAALATYDPAKRLVFYRKIQRVLIDQVPEYVLNWLPEVTAANEDLVGVRPVPVGSDFWNIADWTFAPRAGNLTIPSP